MLWKCARPAVCPPHTRPKGQHFHFPPTSPVHKKRHSSHNSPQNSNTSQPLLVALLSLCSSRRIHASHQSAARKPQTLCTGAGGPAAFTLASWRPHLNSLATPMGLSGPRASSGRRNQLRVDGRWAIGESQSDLLAPSRWTICGGRAARGSRKQQLGSRDAPSARPPLLRSNEGPICVT